jgi:iron complex outermembrane receptor protein
MYCRLTQHVRRRCLLAAALFLPLAARSADQAPSPLEEIIVRVTPMQSTTGLAKEKIPYNIQSADSKDIQDSQTFGIADFMNHNMGSITINETQENPLQPDLQYRGYTASPLLGLPQGMAVYQNGVRINEVLGDTINWDLIPQSSIAGMTLIGGANPLYGLNTLGGALSITTKNGFTHPNHSMEVYGGSFGRVKVEAESGANNGTLGYFATANYFDEAGWRDASSSNAVSLYTALSYRSVSDTTLDLTFNYANTDLTGNGPLPVDLLNRDRTAVFTYPDNTKNTLMFTELEGQHWLNDSVQISGNIFYRNSDSDYFNGNDSGYEDCLAAGGPAGLLCEEDELIPISDQFGNAIASTNPDGSPRDAVNNIDTRRQRGYGGSLQTTILYQLMDRDNQLILGSAYTQGLAEFASRAEIGSLNPDRSTRGVDLFVPAAGTSIDTHTRTWSLYLTDTLSVTDRLDLTVSARYNNTGVNITDHGGSTIYSVPAPALNGEHDYERINPAFGVTYAFDNGMSVYANYSESSRAPTPIELACADPQAPCTLPNAFLADPPLKQVVTDSVELGTRGKIMDIEYHLGLYRSVNSDDIIFISTGGATATHGFFSNVGSTRRMGLEFSLNGAWKRLDWFANYSYLAATYETAFAAPSPNHPLANGNGEIQVRPGDRIPGIPAHTLKLGGDYAVTERLRLGGNLLYNSGVYLRGDEANLLGMIDGYTIINLHGTYRISNHVSAFARIDNLFDTNYETFGLLGDTSGVTFNPPLSNNPRFLSPGAPRAGFVGVKVTF